MTTTALQPTPGQADPGDGSVTAARLRAIVDELSDRYMERSAVVQPLVAAMLAGQHSLLLGPPGTAKSELARDLTSRITGAQLWEILLSKYSDPKKMFGPIDVAALMKGTYTQVWDGRATTAHIGFIDEIFKCGSGALNELLGLLNERLYHPENGGSPIVCPLISAITASNELPSGEESAAVYDRLLVRIQVDYLEDPSNFAKLVRSAFVPASAAAPTTVPLDDLQAAVQRHVPGIGVPDSVVDALCTLRASLRQAGIIVSDRRWRQSVRLLQACAFLAGRSAINVNDLQVLTHVLWSSPEELPTVKQEVLTMVNPDAREALKLLDGIVALEAELDALKGKSREALDEWAVKEATKKLPAAGRRLEEMIAESRAAGRSTTQIEEVNAKRRAVHGRVLVEVLGMDPSMINI
ncbi:AAA family ATPase [Streptosporangium sp. NPDC002721]|uniref:AAA family ATPase n=1 Tax=Streptosporangium sp. NPDC002721 TaxID=3366188 RepID=UPI0036C300DC